MQCQFQIFHRLQQFKCKRERHTQAFLCIFQKVSVSLLRHPLTLCQQRMEFELRGVTKTWNGKQTGIRNGTGNMEYEKHILAYYSYTLSLYKSPLNRIDDIDVLYIHHRVALSFRSIPFCIPLFSNALVYMTLSHGGEQWQKMFGIAL